MSIKNKAQISDTNSEAYCSLVNGIYSQFKELYSTLNGYHIRKSCFFLMMAYLAFEKEVDKELKESAKINY